MSKNSNEVSQNLTEFVHKDLDNYLAQAMAQACALIQGSARDKCPSDTGHLRRSIDFDVEEDGTIFISAVNSEDGERAMHTIKTIVEDPEVGAIYKGRVTRLMTFGAFVEIAPGKEGLVHISKLDSKRVERVEDVVAVGDELLVKVTEIDQQGRINLSRKDALAELAAKQG